MKKRIVSTMLIGLLTAGMIFAGCNKQEVQQTAEEYLAKAENGELSDEDIDLIRENLGEEAASQVAGINEKMKAANESASTGSDEVVAKAESKAAEAGSESKASTESKAAADSSSASTVSSEATTASSAQAESKATTESKAATESSSAIAASSEAAKKAAEEAAAKKAAQEKAAQEAAAKKAAEEKAAQEAAEEAAKKAAEEEAKKAQSAYSTTSEEFMNYLNERRAEAGVDTLAWDSSLGAVAEARAREIAIDYSHNGMRDCIGEIIQTSKKDSITQWYSNWYGSEAHRNAMFDTDYKTTGVGVYFDGNRYYVVEVFSMPLESRGATQEEQAAFEEAMQDAVVVHEDPNTGAQTLMPRTEVEQLQEQGIDPGDMVLSQDDLTEEQKNTLEEALRQLGLD